MTFLASLHPAALIGLIVAGIFISLWLFDKGSWIIGGIFTLASLGLIVFGSIDFIAWSITNWATLLTYFGVYVSIGIVWAFFAFFLYLNKAKANYGAVRARLLPGFLKDNSLQSLEPAHFEDFKDYIRAREGSKAVPDRNLFSKKAMLGQVLLWPFEMFKFFLFDAVKHIVDVIASMFGGVFKRVQKWIFRAFPELVD